MYSAKDARTRSQLEVDKQNAILRKNSMSTIENYIIDAAAKGKFAISYSGYFDEIMRKELVELGYEVKELEAGIYDPINYQGYEIKW